MRLFVSCVSLVCLLVAARAQTAKATIEGLVVHAVTVAPIDGARVTLIRLVRVSNEFSGAEPAATGQTDSQGRFRFAGLDPGGYAVQVELDGYIALTDRHLPPGAGQGSGRVAMMALEGGRSVTDLIFRATPVGVIRGRIVDTAGRPLRGIPIEAFRKTYDENGREVFGSGGAATTNDRGEYRLSVMPRSGYIVLARGGGADAAERYAGSVYPGTTDPANASAIDVGAGGTATLKDLALTRQQLYAIRGRVVDGATGQPPRDASVWITTTSLMGAETITAMPTYTPTTGAFETHVGPGRYGVGVTLLTPPRAILTGPTVTLPPTAREALVTVSNADVEGIVLRLLTPAVSLRVRLIADGGPLSSLPGWETVRVQLLTLRDGAAVAANVLPQTLPAMPDGTFQLFGTMLGDFRLKVTGLPPDAYVQAARLGATDVLNQPLRISEPATDTLEIALRSRGGRINGTVVNDAGQPAPKVQAVLVPDNRARIDLFTPVTTDDAGRFTCRGVAPGAYKIFAWTALEPFAYFDPAILKRFESLATAARVTESSTLDVAVRVISRQ